MSQHVTTWGKGYRTEVVPASSLVPNSWNPNAQSDETYEKVKRSILTNGFVELPQVRELDDGTLQIVNGEHRWRAAMELGMTDIPVINLGRIPDAVAKKLTVITNELRGAPEPAKLAQLIKELSETSSLEDLSLDLPMTPVEMDSLIKSTTAFDWEATEASLPDEIQKVDSRPANLGGERRFQLGTSKGNIPARLCDELTNEFNRSANALGTTNPELVLRHWLERLQATSPAVDAQAAQLASTQTQPATPRAKRKKAAGQ